MAENTDIFRSSSGLVSETFNIEWKINNMKTILQLKDSMSLEDVKMFFDGGSKTGMQTKWLFYLCTYTGYPDYLAVRAKLESSDQTIFARGTVAMDFADGSELCGPKPWDLVAINENESMPSVSMTNISSFLKSQDDKFDGSFNINIKLEILSRTIVNSGSDRNASSELVESSKLELCKNIQQLLEDKTNTDVLIQMGGEDSKVFNAHKIILSARSPVFCAMFESEMKEKTTGTIVVDDIRAEVMEIVLEFIYTGNIKETWKSLANEIVYAAEKYSLPILKEFCDKTLSQLCTSENVMELKKLARLYNLQTADKEISEYVIKNITSVLDAIC